VTLQPASRPRPGLSNPRRPYHHIRTKIDQERLKLIGNRITDYLMELTALQTPNTAALGPASEAEVIWVTRHYSFSKAPRKVTSWYSSGNWFKNEIVLTGSRQ
jgi:hypothetical protein